MVIVQGGILIPQPLTCTPEMRTPPRIGKGSLSIWHRLFTSAKDVQGVFKQCADCEIEEKWRQIQ